MKELFHNKFLLTAVGISVFVLILVLLLSPKKNMNPAGPAQRDDSQASALSGIVPLNLSKEKRDQAMIYVASIESKLPLSLESFITSVGIETTIRISRADYDPAEIVHLDIGGLSYINKNELDEIKNPNVTAFKESYLQAIELLEGQNIDPKQLIFVYSDRPYVRETAAYWVDKLGLLR